MKNSRLIILIAGLAATSSACAQLASWDVDAQNASASNPLAATTISDSNISSTTMTLGGGVSASSAANSFGATGFNTTDLVSALAGEDYISFTITPSSGFDVNFSQIDYLVGLSSAVTSFNASLFSNATGFAAANVLDTYTFTSASPPTHSITLSGVSELQNVNGAVEFRIYGWRTIAGTSTFRVRSNAGDDLTLSGTTAVSAVPEPSTYAAILGAIALMSAMVVRLRKQVA